jgi:CDGSH-type Zn-finger protein
MNNEPVAYVNSMCNDYINWKADPMSIDGQPLYLQPQKYCPSENNEAYEKGFIDGMAKMTESAVHRAVEGMTSKAKDRFSNYESICLQCGTTIYKPFKDLTDEEIAELSDKILCYQIYDNKESGVFEFARAILRKAQEK